MILVLALYALLASTFTLGKMLLFFLPPLLLISMRMVLAGSLLLIMYYVSSGKKIRLTPYDYVLLTGLSFIHIFIPYTTEFMAMQSIAPSCAALMYNLSPFITAFFSYIFFKEKMTSVKWLGFGLGFIGIIYFIKPNFACISAGNFDKAYLLMITSVVSASLGWILVRKLMILRSMPIILINGVAMLLAGFESLIASSYTETSITIHWQHLQGSFWLLLGLIVLIANVIFYNLYGHLLKRYTATFLSFVGFVTPLFTAFYDWIFLGIPVHTDFFITIIVVGSGIYLFYQEELKQGYIVVDSQDQF